MKRYINLIFAGMLTVFGGPAQESSRNYVLTRTYLTESGTPGVMDKALTTVQYYDGFGRPSQLVQKSVTPSGADLVSLTEYDGWGREYRQWLPVPVANNNGVYVPDITNVATNYYNDTKPYTEVILEQSPLNRTLGERMPGQAFHEHPTAIEHMTNEANEVKRMSAYGTSGIRCEGYFAASTLYKTKFTDEDGNVSYEYKDLFGKLILTRSVSDDMNHDTYYVYDLYDNQVCILPPLLSDYVEGTAMYSFDNSKMKEYAYCYKYDDRNRCIEKRLPGCDWVYMIYDGGDKLILSQDGDQRQKGNQWTYYRYDKLGRTIVTGYFRVSGYTTEQIRGTYSRTITFDTPTNTGIGYTQTSFPGSMSNDYLTVNYYDNYDFLSLSSGKATLNDNNASNNTNNSNANAMGLLTGKHIYLLDGSGDYLTTVYYYDNRGRLIHESSTNHMDGGDATFFQYDFAGNIVRKSLGHDAQGYRPYSVSEAYSYEYDHAGRLTKTKYRYGASPEVVLAENTYDETGRLIGKTQHNSQNTVDYTYNIRNWPTGIQDGDFKETLFYCSPNGSAQLYGSTNLYNGNISSATYTSDGNSHTYSYTYDGLNRLTAARRKAELRFGEIGGSLNKGDKVSYNEEFTYDKHGNILTLQRNTQGKEDVSYRYDPISGKFVPFGVSYSPAPFDYLSMEYDGNRLVQVADTVEDAAIYNRKEYHDLNTSGNDFAYDANGNMLYDLDRDIVTIRYNLLNLPDTVQFRDGRQIINKYAADGKRLASTYYTPTHITVQPLSIGEVADYHSYPQYLLDRVRTWFVGNKEYGLMYPEHYDYVELKKVYTDEGYVTTNGQSDNCDYHYYRRDHLGNVREVWKPSGDSALTVQRTRYYPSGLPWEYQAGDSASLQPYKFNGCEFIETHGYDVTDLGNRGVYHAINRFTTMDRFAEKYPWQSPYVHAGNNPVNFVDVGGDFPAFVIPLIKGVAGAVVDAAAQVSVFMANGENFDQSLSKIDYTSVGTSFVTSMFAGPGMSTGTKIGISATVVADAAIDFNNHDGLQTVLNEGKTGTNMAIDIASSVVPGKAADKIMSGLNKAITSDLNSNTAAIMPKEVRSELLQAQNSINSSSGEIIKESTANFIGGLVGGQTNEFFKPTTTEGYQLPPQNNNIIQQNDVTRIQQDYYEVKIKNPW